MNPLKGCPKGRKKCVKNCHQAQKCHSCPYLKECCDRYCLTLPPGSSRALDREAGSIKEEPFVECIESILRRHL